MRCGSCHAAHHRGALTISGTAPDQLETRRTYDHAAPVHAPIAGTPAHVGATLPARDAVPAATAHSPLASAPAHRDGATAPVAASTHAGAEAPARAPLASALVLGGAEGLARPSPASGFATRLELAVLRAQAKDALVGLGWKPGIARAAVDEACAHVGRDATIAVLIRDALRRCPKPTS